MKKLLLLAMLAAPALGFAQGYNYLIVTTADGSERTIDATGVTITFAAGKANFSAADGTTFQIDAAQLQSMRFSDVSSSINAIEDAGQMKVYTATGIYVGNSTKSLQPGVYVVKQYGKTLKMTVK